MARNAVKVEDRTQVADGLVGIVQTRVAFAVEEGIIRAETALGRGDSVVAELAGTAEQEIVGAAAVFSRGYDGAVVTLN